MTAGRPLIVSGAERRLFRFFSGLFTVIVAVACFVGIGTVVTGAGVFEIRALRAFGQVKIELGVHRLRLRRSFDLDDGRIVVAGGHDLVGDQFVALFSEGEFGGLGALAEGGSDDLFAGGDHFVVVIDEADFDLLVFVDEELSVGFDGGDEPATRGAGFDFGVIMFVFGGTGGAGEAKGDGGDGEE